MRNKNLWAAVAGTAAGVSLYFAAIVFKAWNHDAVERAVPAAWLEVLPGLQPVRPSGQTYDEKTLRMYRNTKFLGIETGGDK